jgi:hypothetical protein
MLLFPINLVATTIDLDAQVLRNWIALGMVRPAKRGKKVRGPPHRFSVQQFIGLAHIVTMHRAGHMSRRIIKESLKGFEEMSLEELYEWLHRPEDMHEQERTLAYDRRDITGVSLHQLLAGVYGTKLADECCTRIVKAWKVVEERLAKLKNVSTTPRISGNRYT